MIIVSLNSLFLNPTTFIPSLYFLGFNYFFLLQEFACNGTVIEHPEYGEVLQLQGDQRENICQWLTKSGLAKPEQLKVHGF